MAIDQPNQTKSNLNLSRMTIQSARIDGVKQICENINQPSLRMNRAFLLSTHAKEQQKQCLIHNSQQTNDQEKSLKKPINFESKIRNSIQKWLNHKTSKRQKLEQKLEDLDFYQEFLINKIYDQSLTTSTTNNSSKPSMSLKNFKKAEKQLKKVQKNRKSSRQEIRKIIYLNEPLEQSAQIQQIKSKNVIKNLKDHYLRHRPKSAIRYIVDKLEIDSV
eukprot:403357281